MLATLNKSPSFSAIDRADLQPSTKRQYKAQLLAMLAAKINPFDYTALARYAATLPASSRAFLKAGLRLMVSEALTQAQASANLENLDKIQVLWHRVQAMEKAIVTHQPDAQRLPHWLTQAQVDTVLTLAFRQSFRDYIVLALLFGAGLRREELAELTFDALSRVEDVDMLTLRGKGDKRRSVPIPANLAQHLHNWQAQVGNGYIARSVHKTGKVGASLSPMGIFAIVRKYGAMIGIADLDPHDCRRSAGRLMYQATKDVVKVQLILGHADTKTSLRYIGAQLDLSPAEIIPPM